MDDIHIDSTAIKDMLTSFGQLHSLVKVDHRVSAYRGELFGKTFNRAFGPGVPC